LGWVVDQKCPIRKIVRREFGKLMKEGEHKNMKRRIKMERKDFEEMTDDELQQGEDWTNEIQAERRAANPDPIDEEREALVSGIGNFFKRLKGCKSLDEMWK
jgi:hypothetical protein